MVLTAFLALFIGVALGMLGGGGSILAVPILTYGAGLGAKEAIATSLLVVGTTSMFAAAQHARSGNVAWKTGALFAASAMVGAYGGGFAAEWFSGQVLMILFAVMMVVTAVAMFRKKSDREDPDESSEGELKTGLAMLEGITVGAATGLVGAGGGFLVVPALVLLGGMSMHRAVGTSLLVIALKSFAAFAGHAAHTPVDFATAGVVTGCAVVGTLAAGRFAHLVSEAHLRKAFSVLVMVMAAFVLWREASIAWSAAATSTGLAAAAYSAYRQRAR